MKKATLETLLPLTGLDTLDLEVQLSRLQADRQTIKTEIDNNNKLLKELDVPPKSVIRDRINDIERERQLKTTELLELKKSKRGTSEKTLQLRQEILNLDSKLQDLTSEISIVSQKVSDYKLSRNDARNEQGRLQRYSESKNILSTFSFSTCPRCSQPITTEMKRRENDNHCMLCNRELPSEETPSVNVTKHIGDLDDEIKELDQLINHYEFSIRFLAAQIEKQTQIKKAKEKELDEKMGEHFTSAFISDVESISGEIAALAERIHHENTFLSIWEKLDERYEQLTDLDNKIGDVSDQMAAIKQKKSNDQKKLDCLSFYLNEFISDIYRDYKTSYIDLDTYAPVINNHSYENTSSVQKDLAILGYYYSLLRYSLHEKSYFPRFIMIDTPNKDDMDPGIYDKVMDKFVILLNEKTDCDSS